MEFRINKDSKIINSLRDQIGITPVKETLLIGGTSGSTSYIRVSLPVTLELVNSLKDKTSNSAIGAVTVKYLSSNSKGATVDSKGLITGKRKGTTVITTIVTLYNGKVKVVKSTVTVK